MTFKKRKEELFDVRTWNLLISKRQLKKSEIDKYLSQLPDEEANCTYVSLEEQDGETVTASEAPLS